MDEIKIITVDNSDELLLLNKLIGNKIAISFDDHQIALAIDNYYVIIIPKDINIDHIWNDNNILKIVSKLNVRGNNVKHIGDVIYYRYLPELKNLLLNYDCDIVIKANLMYYYSSLPESDDTYNYHRDAYLLYLTAINEQLSIHGPLTKEKLLSSLPHIITRQNFQSEDILNILIDYNIINYDPTTQLITL